MGSLSVYLLMLGNTLVGSAGIVLSKRIPVGKGWAFVLRCRDAWLSGGLLGVAFLFFLAALRLGDLSLVYPLTSASYLWISLFSAKLLGERMNIFKWCGILLIVAGIVLTTL